VQCVRETEILVEQQPPQGVFVCDHAGLVINKFSRNRRYARRTWRTSRAPTRSTLSPQSRTPKPASRSGRALCSRSLSLSHTHTRSLAGTRGEPGAQVAQRHAGRAQPGVPPQCPAPAGPLALPVLYVSALYVTVLYGLDCLIYAIFARQRTPWSRATSRTAAVSRACRS